MYLFQSNFPSVSHQFISDFDKYYSSLVPRQTTKNDCNENNRSNIHLEYDDKIVNCRNIWFREFWSQHHKCDFAAQNNKGRKEDLNGGQICTGQEGISFEQEGLVPFVGKLKFSALF